MVIQPLRYQPPSDDSEHLYRRRYLGGGSPSPSDCLSSGGESDHETSGTQLLAPVRRDPALLLERLENKKRIGRRKLQRAANEASFARLVEDMEVVDKSQLFLKPYRSSFTKLHESPINMMVWCHFTNLSEEDQAEYLKKKIPRKPKRDRLLQNIQEEDSADKHSGVKEANGTEGQRQGTVITDGRALHPAAVGTGITDNLPGRRPSGINISQARELPTNVTGAHQGDLQNVLSKREKEESLPKSTELPKGAISTQQGDLLGTNAGQWKVEPHEKQLSRGTCFVTTAQQEDGPFTGDEKYLGPVTRDTDQEETLEERGSVDSENVGNRESTSGPKFYPADDETFDSDSEPECMGPTILAGLDEDHFSATRTTWNVEVLLTALTAIKEVGGRGLLSLGPASLTVSPRIGRGHLEVPYGDIIHLAQEPLVATLCLGKLGRRVAGTVKFRVAAGGGCGEMVAAIKSRISAWQGKEPLFELVDGVKTWKTFPLLEEVSMDYIRSQRDEELLLHSYETV